VIHHGHEAEAVILGGDRQFGDAVEELLRGSTGERVRRHVVADPDSHDSSGLQRSAEPYA
jgi:hypothetical protein